MPLPDWLVLWYSKALVGDVFSGIKAIALGFDNDRHLTVRYYLDRDPTDDDRERIEVTLTNVLSNTSSNDEIPKVSVEAVKYSGALEDIDPLDGLVFARDDHESSA